MLRQFADALDKCQGLNEKEGRLTKWYLVSCAIAELINVMTYIVLFRFTLHFDHLKTVVVMSCESQTASEVWN